MFNFFNEWKERKKLEQEIRLNEIIAWENKRRAECEAAVDERNKKMLSKFCPAINDLCRKDCVNFVSASYSEIPDWFESDKALFNEYGPKCKLWCNS